jgi:hypothetical protein
MLIDMLDAHEGEVNKMIYIENQKTLITAGDDRSIRVREYYSSLSKLSSSGDIHLILKKNFLLENHMLRS